ncbi:MAG: sulfatase-like hydrolase/transferase [Candidatus Hydrogenedentes bacterium]|nr:sulfatase-like hydrolase/transferase [Candidatus Hydrogenedentota bacterium]
MTRLVLGILLSFLLLTFAPLAAAQEDVAPAPEADSAEAAPVASAEAPEPASESSAAPEEAAVPPASTDAAATEETLLPSYSTPADINGDFERVSGDEKALWWRSEQENGVGWLPLAGAGRDGSMAMALQGALLTAEESAKLVSKPIQVSPGDALDVKAHARGSGQQNNMVSLGVEARINGEWHALPSTSDSGVMGETWMVLDRYGMIAPAGADALRVAFLGSREPDSTVTAYIDDIECRVTSFRNYAAHAAPGERLPDISLIVPDALRKDALGCYGATHLHTPNVDSFAEEGLLFENATAAAPWTKPSFGSMFTSLYPSQHTAEYKDSSLPQRHETLAETLRARGYFTVGFAFTKTDGYIGARQGFDQGFDLYFQDRDEDEVVAQLLRFLAANRDALRNLKGGGIFIFLHLMQTHAPYLNRAPELVRNDGGSIGTVDLYSATHLGPIQVGKLKHNEADEKYLRDVYDFEMVHTDKIIGEVIAHLKWLGLYERMNVVFTSDHGEAFGERGQFWGHGLGWETVTSVPLILRMPGKLPAGKRLRHLASTLDIMPTLLNLSGAPIPGACVGRSLLLPPGDAETAQVGISEDRFHGWLTVRDSRFKLVARPASRKEEGQSRAWIMDMPDSPTRYRLVDLHKDPWERRFINELMPDVEARLKDQLMEHCRTTGITYFEDEEQRALRENLEMSDETKAMLEALGYVE